MATVYRRSGGQTTQSLWDVKDMGDVRNDRPSLQSRAYNHGKNKPINEEQLRTNGGTKNYPWARGDLGIGGKITGRHAGPGLFHTDKKNNVKGQANGEVRPERINTDDLETKKIERVEEDVYLDDFESGDDATGEWLYPESYKKYEDWEEGETGYFSTQRDDEMQEPFYDDKSFLSINDFNEGDVDQDLFRLDFEKDIMDDFTVVLIGRRRSGKSFMSQYMMYHLRHRFPAGIVITGTMLNNFWAQHVPKEYIHNVDNLNEVLAMVFKRQEMILKHPELGIDPRFFLVLDDVLQDKYRLRFSKMLSKVFTDGRHYNLFTLITTQDPKGIPPDLRENTDCAIIFRQFNKGRKESVLEDFVDYIDNKKVALQFLWNHTGKINIETNSKACEEDDPKKCVPQTLCVLQARVTENLFQIFKTCVARDPGDFVLGDPHYWKAQQKGKWLNLQQDN